MFKTKRQRGAHEEPSTEANFTLGPKKWSFMLAYIVLFTMGEADGVQILTFTATIFYYFSPLKH